MKKSLRFATIAAAVVMMSFGAQAAFAASNHPAVLAHKAFVKNKQLHALLDWTPARTQAQIQALRTAPDTGSVKTFTTTVKDGKKTFTYTMVGKNPFVHESKPSTNVPTTLIPVIVKFSNGDTWDPTAVTSCDSSSAMTRVENSPSFNAQSWSFGGTSVGTAQYEDAFQRAEFYSFTKPGGLNPGYNVDLVPTTHAALTINVPSGDYYAGYGASCGNGILGAVDINYLDSQLQSYITGTLGAGASTTFPLFIMTNVVAYEGGNPGDCCVLGYHSAMTNAGNFQFYGIADYDNSGEFGTTANTAGMTHEIAEAINDPNTVNPTKPWGNIGQVSGCQNNLEVGDPLSGTVFSDSLNGFSYTLQELAFFSWFYHTKPTSYGVNGWYSDLGTFTVSAAKCPPGGV